MDEKITKEMTISDIAAKFPKTAEVMLKYGLHCINCHIAAMESIEQGCKGHGMSDDEINEMVKEMNEIAEKCEEKEGEINDENNEEEE